MKKVQGRTRPKQFNLHLNQKEYLLVKSAAKKAELSMSEYIRQAVVGETFKTPPSVRRQEAPLRRSRAAPPPNDLGGVIPQEAFR